MAEDWTLASPECKFRDNFKHKIILTFSNKYLKVLAETEEGQDSNSIPVLFFFFFLLDTLCRVGGGYCSWSYQHAAEFFPWKMEFDFVVC